MAQITASTAEKVFQIKAWSGLHESPDGDTKLKLGEAAAMKNFRVTRDRNLQRRPGYKQLYNFGQYRIRGMWTGYVNGTEQVICSYNGKVYKLWDAANSKFYTTPQEIGSINTTYDTHFFGFSGKVYMLNGVEYKVWDGTTLSNVETTAYAPLVAVSITPEPYTGSELLEQVNKLTGKRRVWLSPDGTGTVFHLPETGWTLNSIKDLKTNTTISSGYSYDASAGTITFSSAPAQAANGIEVTYTMPTNDATAVKHMRYSELFSGVTDTRVFLYGDGTNEIFYSSVDYDGTPRADYFPDLNEAAIGDANTPVTGLIRHFSKLVIFKLNSTWSCSFNIVTLPDDTTTEQLSIYPVNKAIGNIPLGQVHLVLNSPRTLFGDDVYEWRSNNPRSGSLTADERQVQRISDRVYATMQLFNPKTAKCWDDNDAQEYWICDGGNALVHNYAVDAWYYYTNIPASCFCNFHEILYFGSTDGKIYYFDDSINSDNGTVIDAYWESGSMSFNQDYMRKYSAVCWIGIKPVSNGEIDVTVQTDRKPANTERIVLSRLATFLNVDFGNWSFATNQQPHIKKLKIKAKKFVYYKLILKNNTKNTSAIVTSADIKVRYTGQAK